MFHGLFLQKLRQKSEYFPADSFSEISLLFSSFLLGKWGRNGRERKSVGLLPFRIFIVPLHRNLAWGAT